MNHIFALLFVIISTTSFAQHSTYYIGHSAWGWDLIVGEMVNDLATDAGITTYDYDYQFNGGTCLTRQWIDHASPQGGTDSRVELATGNYDYVIMAEQIPISEVIYSNAWGCGYTSVMATDSFYDLATNANANTKLYLMEFFNEIDQTGPTPHTTWETMNTNMRPLWEQVIDSVNLINNGPDMCLVPVAAAWEALVDSVNDGNFPGITNWIDLFDPTDTVVATIHPTEMTYYLVACVNYATIFGQSPEGLTNQTYAAAGWPFDPPTPAQAIVMQRIAWNTVISDPRSCVSQPNPPAPTAIEEFKNGTPQLEVLSDKQIRVSNSGTGAVLDIWSITGQSMMSERLDQNDEMISIPELPAGMYVASLRSREGRVSSKFVVR